MAEYTEEELLEFLNSLAENHLPNSEEINSDYFTPSTLEQFSQISSEQTHNLNASNWTLEASAGWQSETVRKEDFDRLQMKHEELKQE